MIDGKVFCQGFIKGLIEGYRAGIAYGHPYMIDVQDCDTRLPSSGDFNDVYMDELVRLSILLGRVQKTIYRFFHVHYRVSTDADVIFISPSGLTFTTDKILSELLADMRRWKDELPDHLKFKGPETPQNAGTLSLCKLIIIMLIDCLGLLHLLFSCVFMMFWRVFMRISYSCPPHLKFGLTVELWSELVQMTSDSIDWLDVHERVYDVWLLVAYASTCCALVQVTRLFRSATINIDTYCSISIIPVSDEKTSRLKPSCASYAIVSGDGKVPFQLTICQPDARPVLFCSETLLSLLI